MVRSATAVIPLFVRISAFLFTTAILVMLLQGAPRVALGAPFDPDLTAKYCNALPATFASSDSNLAGDPDCSDSPITASAPEDLTLTFKLDPGNSLAGAPLVFNVPGTVSDDLDLSDGTKTAGVLYETTFSLVNGPCASSATVEFVLYDSTRSGSLAVDPPGTSDRFASIVVDDNADLRADADSPFVGDFPDIYDPLLTPANSVVPLLPRARYTGATEVAGTWILLTVFQFNANDLSDFATDVDDSPHIFGRISHLPTTGTISVIVVDNPLEEITSPQPVSGRCSPETVTLMMLGDPPGPGTRSATPATGTAGISAFSYGYRDADNDGVPNELDTCPFNANIGDSDGDLIDDACDPTPAFDTNAGDHDGDGFSNGQDTCPIVANAATQTDSELNEAYIDAAPDGGPKGDGIGDACDPNPLTSYTEGTAVESYDLAVRCIDAGDGDGDGFCGPQDPDNTNAGITGWPSNAGMDSEFRIAGADPHGDGFGGGHELYWGTDPLLSCAATATANDEATDPHPVDTDDDGDFDVSDVLPLRDYLGVSVPPAPQRFDLSVSSGKVISLSDFVTFFNVISSEEDCLGHSPPASLGSSVPSIEIDTDVTGNGPRLAGGANVQTCGTTTVGGTIQVDIIAPAPGFTGPAGDGIAGFEFALDYDPAVLEVTAIDSTLLLEADAGSTLAQVDDSLPDVDGTFVAGVLDIVLGSDELGPGVLARVTLEGVGAGYSPLTLDYSDLYTMQNGSPEVYGITTTASAAIAVDQSCTPDFTNLSAVVTPGTRPAGAGRVRINSIPLEALPGLSSSVPSAPLSSIPLSSIPLGSIPLSSIPLSSIDVNGVPLSSIPLSSIPLSSIGGWEAALDGTALDNMPLQALTLERVEDDAPEALDGITLAQIELAASSLRGLGIGPLALGSLKLEDIPPPSPHGTWCGGFLNTLSFSCGSDTDADLTMLDLNVRGAPLSSIPLGSIPLSSIPLSSIPLSSIPLSSIPLSSIPLSSIPLSSIPLSSINVAGTPLSSIPLSSIDVPGDDTDDWCVYLATFGAEYTCAALDIDVSDSVQALLVASLETGDPIASTPLSSIPLSSIPLSSIPLSSIPLSSIPLSSIPLSSIPLSSIDVSSAATAAIPLSSIDVEGETLCEFLTSNGNPLYFCAALDIDDQTDDLGDLFREVGEVPGNLLISPLNLITLSSIAASELQAAPLSSIPLSSIPLSSIPLSSIDIAETPLGTIPLSSIDPPGNTASMCDYLSSVASGQYACDTLGYDETFTLAEMIAVFEAATLDPQTALVGIPLSSIPLSSIPLSSIPLSSIPLSSISVSGTPLSSIPLSSINLTTSELGDIPLSSIPLSSIPLSSIPLSSIPLSSIPLSSIPLSSIQIVGNDLSTVPLSSIDPPGPTITVCAYLSGFSGYGCDSGALATISDANDLQELMEAIDTMPGGLEASPLSSIPLSSIDFGPLDLADIPLSSIPLSSIPLSSILLSSIELAGSPLSSIPLSSIEWSGMGICDYLATQSAFCNAATDLAGLFSEMATQFGTVEDSPLSSISLSSIPLSSIPLSSIDIDASPLSSIPLSSIPGVGSIVNCALLPNNCTGPDDLGDAADAGAILPHARLRDVETNVGNYSLGDLQYYSGVSLAQILTGMGIIPGEADLDFFMSFLYRDNEVGGHGLDYGAMTFGDILRGLLSRSDYPWEELPFEDMQPQRFAGAPETSEFEVKFDNVGGSGVGTEVEVVIPNSFAYVPGSASYSFVGGSSASGTLPDPQITGATLTWTIDIPAGTDTIVLFRVRPGLRLGTFTSDVSVKNGAEAESLNGVMAVTVTERFEPENNDPETGPILDTDEILISHIGSATDQDYYRIPVPVEGSRVVVTLSHLSGDADLVMYRATTFGPPPSTGIPLNGKPVEDEGSNVANQSASLSPETKDDVPVGSDVASISAGRGDSNEKVESFSAGSPGFYPIQVTGYNGRFSAQGYVLRVRIIPPQQDVECGARSFEFAPGTPGGSLPSSLDPATKTLILYNRTRLTALYGASEAQDILNALTVDPVGPEPAFISRPEVNATILHIDASSAVNNAYSDWDTMNQCGTLRANSVVEEITTIIDSLTTNVPVESIVIIGSDEVIPFGRVPDTTRISNEGAFASDIQIAAGEDNATWAAMVSRQVLTDNVYGDRNPVPWLDRQLYVPDRAVGRLIETPGEIVNSINEYVAADGRLDPATAEGRPLNRTSLTTGYDFLTDGAEAVDAHLADIVAPGTADQLINDTWTASDLADKLDPPIGDPPDIASVNAHFDHHRLLPADGDPPPVNGTDLFDTADLTSFATELLRGRIVFSMGCHSGLNVPDTLVESPTGEQVERLLDWAQALSQQAAVFVGNTGYGYGDTELVALSERLMVLIAERLDSTMTIGQAVTFAKQEYFAALGVYGVYDEKVLSQATFYGLPMYRVGPVDVPPAEPPDPLATETEPETGLVSASIDLDLSSSFNLVNGDGGSFYEIDGKTQVTHNRPIQPRTEIDITQPGTTAHGALITDLSSTDIPSFDVAFAQPVVDKSENEPVHKAGEVIFPTTIQTVSSYTDISGDRQRLVLMPGQYIDTDAGDGTQRLFTDIEAKVYYSDDDDFIEPELKSTEAIINGSSVSFAVNASDDSPTTVIRVLILYRDIANPGEWERVDLVREGLTDRWTGGAAVSGTEVEYIVQAVDHAGNVAVSTNKGTYFEADIPPALPGNITVDGDLDGSGWYEGLVTVTATPGAGVTFYESVDGGELSLVTGPISVTGDGVHTVRIVGNESPTPTDVTVYVPIDDDPPVIEGVLSPPANGAGWNNTDVNVSFICTDAASGVASCSSGSLVTAEGTTLIPGSATDFVLGHVSGINATVKIDKTDPVTAVSPVDPDGDVLANSVTLNANDPGGSGVAEVRYTVNSGPVQLVAGPSASVTVTAPNTAIEYWSVDLAGNAGAPLDAMFSPDNCLTVSNPGQENADGDAWGDACDNCPGTSTSWFVPASDGDCDGFTNATETTVGTNPTDACGFTAGAPHQSDTWPPDLAESNGINISDVLALKSAFGSAVPPADVRLDLAPSGGINISDVLAIKPFFGKSCTP